MTDATVTGYFYRRYTEDPLATRIIICARCGVLGHEKSAIGAAGGNCRKAKKEVETAGGSWDDELRIGIFVKAAARGVKQ